MVSQDNRYEARQTRSTVHDSPLLRIEDVHCQRPVGEISHTREFSGFEIMLPRTGSWVMHTGDTSTLIDPNSVAFFAPDIEYRNSHPSVLTTRSTAIGVPAATLRNVWAELRGASVTNVRLPHAIVPMHGGFDLLHRQLLRWAVEFNSELALDEIGLRIVSWVLASNAAFRAESTRLDTERRHRELVEATKDVLNRNLSGSVTLRGVAQTVGVSPFHLSRVFSASTGMPVYRYHLRLRILAALERILAGASITEVALGLGFSDHSHLTHQFRREFGVAPSSVRQHPSLTSLQELQLSLLNK